MTAAPSSMRFQYNKHIQLLHLLSVSVLIPRKTNSDYTAEGMFSVAAWYTSPKSPKE
jgi:hypothetical protein